MGRALSVTAISLAALALAALQARGADLPDGGVAAAASDGGASRDGGAEGAAPDAKTLMEDLARRWAKSIDALMLGSDAVFLKGVAALGREVWRELGWSPAIVQSGARRFLPDAIQVRLDGLFERFLSMTGFWPTAELRADPERRFILRDKGVVIAARAILRGDLTMARSAQEWFAMGEGPDTATAERMRMQILPDVVSYSARAAGPRGPAWVEGLADAGPPSR